jgi:hypothetical protein
MPRQLREVATLGRAKRCHDVDRVGHGLTPFGFQTSQIRLSRQSPLTRPARVSRRRQFVVVIDVCYVAHFIGSGRASGDEGDDLVVQSVAEGIAR